MAEEEIAQEHVTTPSDWQTEAITLALGTPIAYFLAYRYEAGYLEQFGLPATVVDLNLQTILTFAAALYGMWFVLWMYLGTVLDLASTFQRDPSTPFRQWFLVRIPGICLAIVLLNIYGSLWRYTFTIAGGFLLLFLLFDFLPAYSRRKKAGSFAAGLKSVMAEHDQLWNTGREISRRLGQRVAGLMLFTLLAGIAAGALGSAEAIRKTEFWGPADDPNWLAVRFSADRAILVSWDEKKHERKNEFRIVRLDEPGAFVLRKTGKIATVW